MHIKLSDLKHGPIQHEVLPEGFINKVQKYKHTLKEVEKTSLEEVVSNFQRDFRPERELLIWETIAQCYETYVTENPKASLKQRKKHFADLLVGTMSSPHSSN